MTHTAIIQNGGLFIPNIDLGNTQAGEVMDVELLTDNMTTTFPVKNFKFNIHLVQSHSVNVEKDKDSLLSARPLYDLMQKWKSENSHDEDWSDAFDFNDEPEMDLDVF